jgi:hypothetical protein
LRVSKSNTICGLAAPAARQLMRAYYDDRPIEVACDVLGVNQDAAQDQMSQLGAYDAGLTDDPGCWVQPIEVCWSSRLDPRRVDYHPDFVARVEWEEPGPGRDGPESEPGGLEAPGYRHNRWAGNC